MFSDFKASLGLIIETNESGKRPLRLGPAESDLRRNSELEGEKRKMLEVVRRTRPWI